MQTNPSDRFLALIYAATIFTSAFLLFQIQPMVSKAILPWFGGTPAVWTICLLFFQSLLFAGYAYAHFSNTWLPRRQQAILHIAIIIAALVLLRVLPDASWQPHGDTDPTRQILFILAVTIGLPYFVLSATGPLLQAWFAHSFPDRTPYRLYALSNLGSLLALVSYPFLFEHLFDLPWQARLWSAGFITFGMLCGFAAWRVWATQVSSEPSPSGRGQGEGAVHVTKLAGVAGVDPQTSPQLITSPRLQDYLLWLILPAFASVVLMATTNHVSTDVAVVPLLWVVPLALYLLTFIIAFDRPAWYRRTLIAVPTLIAIYVTALCSYAINKNGVGYTDLFDFGITGIFARSIAEFLHLSTASADGTIVGPQIYIGFRIALFVNYVAMFGICLLCHGELARLKPHPRYLTAYYLLIAAGGALGGIAVSLVATHLFKTVFEWKLTIFAAAIGSIGFILYALVGRAVASEEISDQPATSPLFSRLLLVLLLVPTSFVLLDLTGFLYVPKKNVVFQERNFFGTLLIREREPDDPLAKNLVLLNGTTIHGSQFTSPQRRGQPTSYYGTPSGIGRVLNFFRANRPPGGVRIGDVGLGTGTLAAYVTKGDYLTFFEINPAVIDMATSGEWFTYIADCRARGAQCDIKLGDARLALEREVQTPKLPRYHVLVLDAFSGDAVPTHLLTAEAYQTYLPRLATAAVDGADGALVIHVSNRYLDLSRVVRAAAEKFALSSIQINSPGISDQLINTADWVILTRNDALFDALLPFAVRSDTPPKPPVLWTDARSSLFEIMK